MPKSDEERLRELHAEVLVGELRDIERKYRRLEDLGIFDSPERTWIDAESRWVKETDGNRGISRCQVEGRGFRAYGVGPCFDTFEQAVAYRDVLDHKGATRK